MTRLDERAIGERVRAARLAAALSQRDLAARADVGERTLSNLEAGRGSTLGVLLAVTNELGGLDEVARRADQQTAARRTARLPYRRSTSPRREDRIAFERHRAVVRKLRANPDEVIAKGLAGVERKRASDRLGPHALQWVDDWEAALRSGPRAVEALCLQDDDEGSSRRQESPFFGVLSEHERLDALRRA